MSHDEYRGDIDDPRSRSSVDRVYYKVLLALPQYR